MGDVGRHDLRSGWALQWIVAGLIALSGVGLQIFDAMGRSDSYTHVLFGLLLGIGVVCRFKYGLWIRRQSCVAEIKAFARQLTRTLYLLLYALLAVKLILNLVDAGASFTSPEMFQPYLAAGLAAILLTHVLAFFSAGRSSMALDGRDLVNGAAAARPR